VRSDVVGHGRKTGSCTEGSLGEADRDAAVHGRLDARRDEPRHAAPGGQHQLGHPRGRVTAVWAAVPGSARPSWTACHSRNSSRTGALRGRRFWCC